MVLQGKEGAMVRHSGGCHCGSIRFQVLAPPTITVVDCNCSICVKKQHKHFIVPLSRFKLLRGHDTLRTYSFNTHQAKHTFCGTCGVQPFHIPKSSTDEYGIAPHCLDDGTVTKVLYEKQDGKNSEKKKGNRLKNYFTSAS